MELMYIDRMRFDQEKQEWGYKTECEQLDVEGDFAINEDQIEREICRMGQLMARYGELAAVQEANLKRLEEKAKYVAAQLSGAIRSTAEKSGQKTTEGKILEELTQQPEYQSVLAILHTLRADAIKADHWWRAIIKKADLLNALCYRQSAEFRRV